MAAKPKSKKKSAKVFVMLKSTQSHHFYMAWKNPKTDKLNLRKYDPVVRQNVEYVEKKAPSPKK